MKSLSSALLFVGMFTMHRPVETQKLDNYDPNDCFYSAICNLIRSDMFRLVGRTFNEHLRDAAADFTLFRQIQNTNNPVIIKRCSLRLKRCEIWVKNEMKHVFGVPFALVDNCDVLTFPYSIFRCETWEAWTIGVNEGTDYPHLCGQACDVAGYTKYHAQQRGIENITVLNWQDKLKVSLASAAAAEASPDSKPPPEIELKIPEGISTLFTQQSRMEKNLSNTYFQAYKMGVGDYEPEFRCPDSTWMANAIDYFPVGMASDCRGEWLREGSTPDIGVYRYGGKVYDRIAPIVGGNEIDCWNKIPQQRERSFLSGIRFLVKKLTYTFNNLPPKVLDYIVSASYLCSGEESWSAHRTMEDATPARRELRCPQRSVMCSIQFRKLQYEGQIYITNVKAGCCELPLHLHYSALTYTAHQLLQPSGESMDELTSKSIHRNYSTISTLHFCNAGEFISQFSATMVVPNNWSPNGFLQLVPMLQLRFNCTHFEPRFLHPFRNADLYAHVEPQSNLFQPNSLGNFQCDAFYKGGFLEISPLEWKFGMTCSNRSTTNTVLTYNSFELMKHPAIDSNYVTGRGEFVCPDEHAICGIEIQASRIDDRGKTIIPLLGYFFKFLCCPVFIRFSCPDLLFSRTSRVAKPELVEAQSCPFTGSLITDCTFIRRSNYTNLREIPTSGLIIDSDRRTFIRNSAILSTFGIVDDVKVERLVEEGALGEGYGRGMYGMLTVADPMRQSSAPDPPIPVSTDLFDFEPTLNASKPDALPSEKEFSLDFGYKKSRLAPVTVYSPTIFCEPEERTFTMSTLVIIQPELNERRFCNWADFYVEVGSDTNTAGSEAEFTHPYFGYGVQIVRDMRKGNDFLQPWFIFNYYYFAELIRPNTNLLLPRNTHFFEHRVNRNIVNPYLANFHFNVTFAVPPNKVGRYYRVILTCSQWRIVTNSYWIYTHDVGEAVPPPDKLEPARVTMAKTVLQIYPDKSVLDL